MPISKADLETIALLEMSQDVSKNVKGMEGLLDHVVKNQSLATRKLMARYLKIKEDMRKKFIKDATAAGWDKPLDS